MPIGCLAPIGGILFTESLLNSPKSRMKTTSSDIKRQGFVFISLTTTNYHHVTAAAGSTRVLPGEGEN